MNAPINEITNDVEAHQAFVAKLNASVDFDAMSEEELWHHERRLGIGGSDVAAILGCSKWDTPLDIYNQKRGYVPPKDLSNNERVYFGNVLEDVVAKEYARRYDCKVQRRNQPVVHPDLPWMRANLDRVVVGEKKVLECKTADAFTKKHNWGEEDSNDIPDNYFLQCTHYLICTGYEQADLAVLIGGNEFRRYTIDYDSVFAAMVIERLRDFWVNHVLADVPPEPISLDEINQSYSQSSDAQVMATDEVSTALETRRELNDQKAIIEERLKEQDTIIKGFMGANDTLIDQLGRPLATWKTSKPSRRFNSTEFKKVHPDLYSEFTTESAGSRRFLVK